MSVDRSRVLQESHPGAKNDIERDVQARGGWVCEEHLDRPWPHDDCPGPGMPASDAPCPQCGGELQLVDGRYEAGDGRWLVCEDCDYELNVPVPA